MRFLYLNHNVRGSGTYQRASNFGFAMAARGHEVTVVTTSRRARLRMSERFERGVRVIESPDLWWGPARTGWDPWNTVRRVVRLLDDRFDLVHAFDARPAVIVPALAATRAGRAPLFLDWADWWGRGGRIQERSGWPVRTFFGPVETWFEEAFRRRAVGNTVISTPLAGRAEALGIPPSEILCLPNGCDTTELKVLSRESAREQLRLPADAPLLGYLGRVPAPDLPLLMNAFRLVRATHPQARLLMIGDPAASLPRDLLQQGAITPTGFVTFTEMNLWLAAADICVVPMTDSLANRARLPGKLSEYLSAGRATVMTDVSDSAAMVRRERLGWVAAATPEAVAEAIRTALANPQESAEAGRRARALAEGEMGWPALSARLEAFYYSRIDAVAGGGRTPPAAVRAAGFGK